MIFPRTIPLAFRITKLQVRMAAWRAVKEDYLNKDLQSRREGYFCGDKFVLLDSIKKLSEDLKKETVGSSQLALEDRVSLYKGDITRLEVDAIVNAANNSLLGGGGVDGAIHTSAGHHLLNECKTLEGCNTGEAKLTGGYKLPAKYIIHTVGPIGENSELLSQCYENSLKLAQRNQLTSIAFPCISTGVYSYPNEAAAHVALSTTKKFLENDTTIERVIFCVFMDVDEHLYKKLMPKYFSKL